MKSLGKGFLGIVLAGSIYSGAQSFDDFDFNPLDPTIVTRPDKWVQPQNLINPYNPLNPNSFFHDNVSTETCKKDYIPQKAHNYKIHTSTQAKKSEDKQDMLDTFFAGYLGMFLGIAAIGTYVLYRASK